MIVAQLRKHIVLTSGNRQFLAMVTSGSQVGNRKFQGLGTGSSLAMATFGSHVGNHQFQPLGNGSSWQL